jgi:hypothetical protein
MQEVAHLFFFGGASAEGLAFEIWIMEANCKRALGLKETIETLGLEDDQVVFVDAKPAAKGRPRRK